MRVDRLDHGVRVVHLHANHLDLGPHCLDVVGHARHQAAAADGHKHGIELVAAQLLQLAQDLHGNRALAGNHVGVVKGVHKGQPLLFLQPHRVVVGIRITVSRQHHLAAQRLHGVDLELWRGGGHHHHGTRAQLARAHGHALCVVAGRGANHPLLQLLGRQVGHLVVGATQLEAEHRLLVFALQEHLVVQAAAQVLGGFQGRLHGHVIDAGGQDLFQVIERGEVLGHVRQGVRRHSGGGGQTS